MQTLLAIDVGCEFVVDRAGLTDGSAPAFSLVYNDGERLTVDARDASLTTRSANTVIIMRPVVVLRQTTPATSRADVRDGLGHQLDLTLRPPLCACDAPIPDDLAQDS